jgi:eukaryotic-like serine/threonine-protein kinase
MSDHAAELEQGTGDGVTDPLLGCIADRRYRIDRKAGEGGFGTVYAATHMALGALVALKVLRARPDVTEEDRAARVGRFMDEGRVLPRLRHPNIVAALDLGLLQSGPGQPVPYLVMEWCAGSTLRNALAESGPLPLPLAWRLFEPIVDAMAFAHGLGVVHRDLKPANVMLDTVAGRTVPRIIDFGIAKVVEDAVHETGLESFLACTPAYAAPEQLRGGCTDSFTDVHALALIFTELVSGQRPFGAGRGARADLRALRPSPATIGVDVGAFEPVIARALALRPGDRHADAEELGDALRHAACAMGLGAGQTLIPVSVRFTPRAGASTTVPRPESSSPSASEVHDRLSRSQLTDAHSSGGTSTASPDAWTLEGGDPDVSVNAAGPTHLRFCRDVRDAATPLHDRAAP